ncbi:MAG: HD-GYP domain-containing protein, partial [Thermodesulfobacteriota bacterium]
MKQARKQHPISDFGMGISDLFSAFRNPQSEIEKRDPYRAIHQRRVADLAGAIAVRMGLSQDQADRVHMAAIIHDLGKIFIPTDILSKRSQLTETEFDLIKTHPRVGYDILRSMEFPWPVAQIILQHHERMDGSGYPFGQPGTQLTYEIRRRGHQQP